ncbi:MAG: hypothetical protein OZ921_17770 [Sorangiineae bacterium]|nr:hypothetical protein [Polyangiaceae bacterium]MEB2324367.1 hypothetical protein [Sorangiineae bacterium]
MSYPGPARRATWLYAQDHARWTAAGFFASQPPAPAPGYPVGTDLGGMLWMHDPTTTGATAHGLVDAPSPCVDFGKFTCIANSIADSYQPGVAPDRRVAGSLDSFTASAQLVAAPLGDAAASEAPLFPGAAPGEPLPVISVEASTGHALYWLSGGRRFSADAVVSPRLRAALVDPELFWVAASEPVATTQSVALPRAVALTADGSRLTEALLRTDSGYQLSSEAEPPGDGDQNPIARLTPALQAAAGPSPRSGFGATLSRVTGVLAVVGGRDALGRPLGDVWTLRHDGWQSQRLFGAAPPADVTAATYAWRGSRVWLVAERAGRARWRAGHAPRRMLYRVDPDSGWIDGVWPLGALGWAEHLWLTATADGRVVLTAAGEHRWLLAVLSSARPARGAAGRARRRAGGPPALDGFAAGEGTLAAPPRLSQGRITGALLRRVPGGRALDLRILATLGTLQHGPCELDADLR